MFAAITQGKLPRGFASLEDFLTSIAFGVLLKLDATDGLLRFLAGAEALAGAKPLSPSPGPARVVHRFWPQVHEDGCEFCEPDLELVVSKANGRHAHIFIEAKHLSGKSSVAGQAEGGESATDQLAKQWQNLCKREQAAAKAVVYLTPHYAMPVADLREAHDELAQLGIHDAQLLWLSWRDLPPILDGVDSPFAAELAAVLRDPRIYDFGKFSGFTPAIVSVPWCFEVLHDR